MRFGFLVLLGLFLGALVGFIWFWCVTFLDCLLVFVFFPKQCFALRGPYGKSKRPGARQGARSAPAVSSARECCFEIPR